MPTLHDHANLPATGADRLAHEIEGLVTLEEVIRWGLALPEERSILEVIVQDEYCHDVVMEWEPGFYLVFDTT